MQRRRAIVAIFALGMLLISPFAWGCEGAGMEDCSMSACPMGSPKQGSGCHDSTTSWEDHGLSSCSASPPTLVACCDAPVDQEPAQVDTAIAHNHGTTSLIVLAERVERRPPCKPPDSIFQAVSSQQYETGRFTLLSAFLL